MTLNIQQKGQDPEATEKNKKEGEEYLAKNKTKNGVIVTSSGLQYEVLMKGNGPKPKISDKVRVNYRGTLIDGSEFDSSYKRNKPAEFAVNRLIPGWTEALQLMNVGSKYKLTIPSKLGYGSSGNPGIPPHSVLVFELELLGIVK
jgi:FKBP-type peptidyl-prolyl cis-trans isomerase